jgi:putative ABC transport system permease protein
LRLALSALYQQKVRTLLTTLGVVFGTFVLVVSLSVRHGVHDTVLREYGKLGELRRIDVGPSYAGKDEDAPADKVRVRGKMGEDRRQRLRRMLVRRWRQNYRPDVVVRLTAERLRALAALEHVRAVEPVVSKGGRVYLDVPVLPLLGASTVGLLGSPPGQGPLLAASALVPGRAEGPSEPAFAQTALPDDPRLRKRVVAGDYLSAEDERGVVVSEFLLYLLGVRDDADLARVVGKTIRLECRTGGPEPRLLLVLLNRQTEDVTAAEERVLHKLQRRLPDVLGKLKLTPAEKQAARSLLARPALRKPVKEVEFTQEYTVRGVVRLPREGEARNRFGWANDEADVFLSPRAGAELFYRVPANRERGFLHAVVEVDSLDHVKEVSQQIRAMGLEEFTLVDLIEREQLIYLLVFTGMTAIAAVSLLVAGLGITNTMLMSVLERVREIGIMKAVGARDGHIQLIFLVEGALVGLVGGLLGLLLGWAASIPGDAWVRGLVRQRLALDLQQSIFVFPWWLVAGVPAFACLVTTLAALYPARRAARVNPITALRHD